MRKSRLQEKTEVSCSMEREARREAKKSLETSFRDARTERDAVLAQAKTLNDGLAVRVASHMARADYAADCEEILHEYRT
jgi:vacuolar-type H+-ATPase subunit H